MEDNHPTRKKADFIREIIKEDLETKKHDHIVTRFPPEPNGYLHIGHAKALCLNFSAPLDFPAGDKSKCHLRMDDTNPTKEDTEFVDAIQEDIKWLGFGWGNDLFYASDYYEKLYGFAVELIEKGLAYVDEQTPDQIREGRGTLTEPGVEGPYRDRSVDENIDLFKKMRDGGFEDGACVLRAKIDMEHPNLNMRDPVLYRIMRAEHHRTGNDWCIYPLYDFAHPLSDALEGITHSLCSLEFEHHRPLYDWFVENCSVEAKPRQIEFARLNLTYTVMSKRKLARLVEENLVEGWDDPRMPTLSGMRRRGFPPEAIRTFIEEVGITKTNSLTDVALLEHHIRERLNETANRAMGVIRPLKLVITNLEETQEEILKGPINPEKEELGDRDIPFSNELWIEQDDFMEDPPRKYFRLKPGGEVRLRNSYIVRCDEVIKDENGNVVELRGEIDPDTLGKHPADGRKVKGVIHWVSAKHATKVKVNLYDRLFLSESPESGGEDFVNDINPDSIETIEEAWVEPFLVDTKPGEVVQFLRLGYFTPDSKSNDKLCFNRTVGLRDSWAAMQKNIK